MFSQPEQKTCTTCGRTKHLGEFYRNRTTHDGRQSRCAECHRADMRQYRRRLRERNRGRTRDPSVLRRCPQCGQDKPETAFRVHPSTTDGLSRLCVTCGRRPTSKRQTTDRPQSGFKGYDLSRLELVLGFELQGRACPICRRPVVSDTANVDHDHETGKVRGILCRRCNPALGLFRDDPEILQRAAEYLDVHREACDRDDG